MEGGVSLSISEMADMVGKYVRLECGEGKDVVRAQGYVWTVDPENHSWILLCSGKDQQVVAECMVKVSSFEHVKNVPKATFPSNSFVDAIEVVRKLNKGKEATKV